VLSANDRFTRTLIKRERRLMIRSVCAKCGESKVVSASDGTLDDWEDSHKCCDQATTATPDGHG
jgi:hypothetical protein